MWQDLEQGLRLACQTQVKSPTQVNLLATTSAGYHILEDGIGRDVRLQPAIKKHFLPLGTADWKTKGPLAGMIQKQLDRVGVRRAVMDVSALQSLGALEPAGKEGATALFYGSQILGFEAGDTSRQLWGLAVDIGTTTVVGATYATSPAVGLSMWPLPSMNSRSLAPTSSHVLTTHCTSRGASITCES